MLPDARLLWANISGIVHPLMLLASALDENKFRHVKDIKNLFMHSSQGVIKQSGGKYITDSGHHD